MSTKEIDEADPLKKFILKTKMFFTSKGFIFLTMATVIALVPGAVHFLIGKSIHQMDYIDNCYFWTRSNIDIAEEIDITSQSSLSDSSFLTGYKTFIIIHGFLGSGQDDWILTLKNALLKREKCNVISVNWKSGTTTLGYYVVQGRVEGVGSDLAQLISFLEKVGGVPFEYLHLIGHSLGAHVAGFAGKKIKKTIGRITGLDPASLMYRSASAENRLDKSDAIFVDVIHTHGCSTSINKWADCFGINENLGHADFWPNGGQRQPACASGDGVKAVKDGSSCDHGMAYVLFTESVHYSPSSTHFVARQCESWDEFELDLCPCSSHAQYMGFNANAKSRGVFFLNTSSLEPFALLDPSCPAAHFTVLQVTGFIFMVISLWLMVLVLAIFFLPYEMKQNLKTQFITSSLSRTFGLRRWLINNEDASVLI